MGDDSFPSDQTPSPQVHYLAAGPTPDTPLAAHPTAVNVPARSTSPPPSPSSFRPRNLDLQLLAAASSALDDNTYQGGSWDSPSPLAGQSTSAPQCCGARPDGETERGLAGSERLAQDAPATPLLPLSLSSFTVHDNHAALQSRMPQQQQQQEQGMIHEARDTGEGVVPHLGSGDVWRSSREGELECSVAPSVAPELEPVQQGGDESLQARAEREGIATATGLLGDKFHPPTPSPSPEEVMPAATATVETSGCRPEGSVREAEGRLEQGQEHPRLVAPEGSAASLEAPHPEPPVVEPAAQAPTPGKAAGVPRTPARKAPASGPHKGSAATPVAGLTPGTDRRPTPWGAGSAARGSASAAGNGSGSAGPRQLRNVFPAIAAAAAAATPRSPVAAPAAGSAATERRGAPRKAAAARGCSGSPGPGGGGGEERTSMSSGALLLATTSTTGLKLAGVKATTPSEQTGSPSGAGVTPRYAAPTAAFLARTHSRGAGGGGGALSLRQSMSARLPASPPAAGSEAAGRPGSRRQPAVPAVGEAAEVC